MFSAVGDYFRLLSERFGSGWNRFWYRPSDPLTLCVLRVATGLVVLYWHFTFTFDLLGFFDVNGLLPAEVVSNWARETGATSWGFPTVDRFSYLSYVTNPTALLVVHWIGFAVLLAFTVGLFTRYTSIGALIVALSYMHRAPMLSSQVEPVIAMVLFYLCLGPCGATLSVDRWWQRRRAREGDIPAVRPSPWATVSRRLLQLHVSALCLMLALSQLGGSLANVWWGGDAFWILAADQGAPLRHLMFQQPYLIDFLTHTFLWFELLFPVLVWNRTARPLVLGVAVLMWGLLALASGFTTFCLMMIIASFVFVPPAGFHAFFGRCLPWWNEERGERADSETAENGTSAESPKDEQIRKSANTPRRRKAKTK